MTVDGNIQLGYKDSAWFTANASFPLLEGQIVYLEQTGTYKIGDGVTVLSALSFLGGGSGSGVQSVLGTTVDNTDPLNPVVNTPTLQEVSDEDNTFTGELAKSPDGLTTVNIGDEQLENYSQDTGNNLTIFQQTPLEINQTATNGTDTNTVQLTATTFTKNDIDILTLDGGFLTGLLGEAKSSNIASATITNLATATGNLAHITGSTTINSFGTLPAGVKVNLVFDAAPIITNSANIICPGNVSINAAANDTAIIISEGGGVWRFLTFWKYDESYTNYTPSFTGFSIAPTINIGDARWKMLTKNTCHVIIWGSGSGTSNATTTTVSLPFTAAWSGGAGFGLQQSPMGMINNGAQVNGCVRTRTGGSNILDCYPGVQGSSFTASGGKSVFLNFIYQIEI